MKNTRFTINNEQRALRRDTFENDRRVHSGLSYSAIAAGEANTVSGRYRVAAKTRVIGTEPVTYPQLPANSPWHHDPVPAEKPIGFDVSAVPVVGEPHEIALAEAHGGAGPLLPAAVEHASPGGDVPRADAGSVQSPVRAARRRRPKKRRS